MRGLTALVVALIVGCGDNDLEPTADAKPPSPGDAPLSCSGSSARDSPCTLVRTGESYTARGCIAPSYLADVSCTAYFAETDETVTCSGDVIDWMTGQPYGCCRPGPDVAGVPATYWGYCYEVVF